MGLTYFKRYRMELDLDVDLFEAPPVPPEYEFVGYDELLIRDHAQAKFESFRLELDSNVFPCLGRRDGCLRLMREITGRSSFVPAATWLLRYRPTANSFAQPIGTVQGLESDEWGSIQNLGVSPDHRGRGLGTQLLRLAAIGFRQAGLRRMHLEVTTDNTAAVRLYQRLGFRPAKVVYKSADLPEVALV